MLAEDFHSLFSGLDRAYGRYDVDSDQSGVKQSGTARTIPEKLTTKQWELHLSGTQGLGVVPIRDDAKVLWAAIDIDEYVVDIANNEGLVEGLHEIDGGVTVHHACHSRAQNMGIKARDMLKLIPNAKIDVVERCAGHGGTFGVMKGTHDLALKVGRPTARQIKTKNNKYMASDCPLAGKHLKQLEIDTNISNDEAVHPIELIAKSYRL